MKPTVSPVRITVVDFFASFLPGAVWLSILYCFILIIRTPTLSVDFTPLTTISSLAGVSSVGHTAALLIGCYLLGCCVSLVATDVTERIVFLDKRVRFRRSKPNSEEWRFPYNADLESRPFFKQVDKTLRQRLGFDWHDLPGHQPFSACRRALRVMKPELWEECERNEATTRMLGSLFLASLVAILAWAVAALRRDWDSVPSFLWLFGAVASSLLLAYLFRKSRIREVEYAYLSFLLATRFTWGTKS